MKYCTKWAPPWTLFPGGRGSYGPKNQLKQLNIQSIKPDTASSEPHPGPRTRSLGKGGVTQTRKATKEDQVSPTLDPETHSLGKGELQTRKATKEDQVSPTLDPVTCSLREGGVTDQVNNQRGSSELHPGPSDPFPGGGRRHRPEKQPKRIKWAPPWTQWPVP